MTQPQDKMRAEFEAWACDRGYQRDELARCKIGIVSPAYYNLNTEMTWQAWQAACAKQSVQSQQDALDAARYRWLSNALADKVKGVSHHFCNVRSKIELDQSVDASIATQGASNV